MKKIYSISRLMFMLAFLGVSSLASAQDLKIQHIQDDIGNTGGTNTSFTAVSSLNNAFALPTNNRKTHAGRADGDTGPLEGDDMAGARVLTGTGTLTYYRESGSITNSMRFNTDIWEYIGAPGGANEFIVRGRYAASLPAGGTGLGYTYVDIDVSGAGIVTPNKVVPIITGIMNDDTTDGADSATGIAHLSSSTNLVVRKGTSSNNVTIYITLVEFTGSNWTVLHGDATSTANTGSITLYDGYDATGTATNVSSWSNSLIFTQSKAQTQASGGEMEKIRSQWPMVVPGADNQTVDWSWDATRVTTSNSNRHFIHVLNNPDMTVTRYTDTSYAAGETTIDITSAGLTDITQSSVVGSFITAGNGKGYAQGFRNYYLNSTTQAAHWCAKSGNAAGVSHNIQIIDFVTIPPTTTQGPGGVVAEIELWLKANTGVEEAAADAAEDGDNVLNWLDNSINGNDATQATGANQPVFNTGVINFNPTIDFDGTNHELLSSTTPNDSITIFVVGEGTYGGTTKNIVNHNNGGSGSIVVEQTAATTLQGRYYDGTSPSGIVTTTIANGTPFLVEYAHLAGGNSELFEDGISQGTASANADNLSGTLTTYIGGHTNTAKRWDGGVAEVVIYNQLLTTAERDKVESYFAIKYGFTLGVNGTSQDYVDSDGTTIWDQSANAGYNYNVAGIGRDDASNLEQKQSITINTTDDITVGIKDIATTNEGNATDYFVDKSFLMWGHNNGNTTAGTDLTKDFGATTGTTTNVSATPIERIWKMVVTDTIPTIKLSIPESMVSATNPGGEEYIMIVADDAAFTTNLTSATMDDVGTELEVDFYFEGTKYITFGSTAISAEVSRAAGFDRTQDTYLDAGDVNDLANMDYTISAWVKRNTGVGKFDVVSKRNYFNENRDIDPGPDNDGNYTHGYAFRINSQNQFRMVWRDPEDATNNIMQTSATIPEDEWHHIAATFDSSTNMTSLYIDGYLEDQDDTLDPMETPSDAHFLIGAAHHLKRQQKHDGEVDEVRVWDVALTGDQIRYIMNQEIEENATLADGKVLPSGTTRNEIISIPWNNLIAYYPMSRMVFGSIKDESNSGNDASMMNYNHLDAQTAPLPYQTTANGDWDDPNTWVNGNVQYLPGVDSYLDALETIDYNIVEISHNVTLDNSDTALIPASRNGNRTVLGLIINSGELEVQGSNETDTGYGITVSHYLKIDGKIDLEGQSQLIQGTDSDLDVTSSGTLEKDQQGTADFYTYNYWSAPVGVSNTTTNNNSYTLPDVMNDGTTSSSPQAISWLSSGYDGTDGSPVGIADYWVWKYANQTSDDYASWQHVRSTGSIQAGEGFTMKGTTDTGGLISTEQNYVFDGKPHNGDVTLTLSAGNDYLIGNPYASSIDADEFILDNISVGSGGRAASDIIDGTLYFWDHFANSSHYLEDYEGGYATYNLLGATVAISNDTRINNSGQTGTKTPGQYVPVGQGFFVTADAGGTVTFKNSQRAFEVEGGASSQFMRAAGDNEKGDDRKRLHDKRKKIWIMYESPNGYHRQLMVGVDNNATQGFDTAYDAPLIENNNEDLYWNIADNPYVIQGVDNIDDDQVLPLGIRVEQEGTAVIRIDNMINIEEGKIVYLHDKDLGVYHNLRDSNYEIFLPVGEFTERFEITFGSMSLSDPEVTLTNLDMHYANSIKSIVINNPTNKLLDKIEMINILGQSVYANNLGSQDNLIELKISNLGTGAYILKLNSENGTITKKVIVE